MEVLEPEVTKLMNFMYFQVKGIEIKNLLPSLYACSVCLILYAQVLNLVVIFWGRKKGLSEGGSISNACINNLRSFTESENCRGWKRPLEIVESCSLLRQFPTAGLRGRHPGGS